MESFKLKIDLLEKQLISCQNVFDKEIDNLKNTPRRYLDEKKNIEIDKLKIDNKNLVKKIEQIEKQNSSIEKYFDEFFNHSVF